VEGGRSSDSGSSFIARTKVNPRPHARSLARARARAREINNNGIIPTVLFQLSRTVWQIERFQ